MVRLKPDTTTALPGPAKAGHYDSIFGPVRLRQDPTTALLRQAKAGRYDRVTRSARRVRL
jgi:hypothetical protein